MAELRDAEITIVGGGAVGCAVAYVLAREGYPDIQVVERGELAGATSSQAAGLVGQVRTSPERTRLAMASVATYSRIEQETGHTADWRQTGSIRIAMTEARVDEFRAMAGIAVPKARAWQDRQPPPELAELCEHGRDEEAASAGLSRAGEVLGDDPGPPLPRAASHQSGMFRDQPRLLAGLRIAGGCTDGKH